MIRYLLCSILTCPGLLGLGLLGFGQQASFALQTEPSGAESPRVEQRTLDSHFPFFPPDSVEEWTERSAALRLHLQMSLGLWPWPDKTPLNPVEHGTIDQGDYTVSKVFFESFPGYYVTGSLYRPKVLVGPAPVILSPHGHFANGRFTRASEAEIDRMLSTGEETHRDNARSVLQARCAHLARMGCVVFHYDMIGYADSQQIPYGVAHGFAKQRGDQNGSEAWGFFSPRAELHLQSIMGLQTWNSLRAIDYVLTLPEVDPQRVGVTGCSGGGTQTFLLAALDPRVAVAFPAAMVSTGMQGGCTCENACNLRVITGNVEIAALFAPRPMGLSAANDWTKQMPTDGYPQLQSVYRLLSEPENVFLSASLDFPHGYNQVARRVMYGWFDRHLKITGQKLPMNWEQLHAAAAAENTPWFERPIRYLESADLSVWNAEHLVPPSGVQVEQAVTRHWQQDQASKIAEKIEESDPQMRSIVRSLLCDLPGGTAKDSLRILNSKPMDLDQDTVVGVVDTVGNQTDTAGYQFTKLQSARGAPVSQIVCLVQDREWVADDREIWLPFVAQGDVVVLIDGRQWQLPNRIVNNGRDAAGYTFGYNRSEMARGVRALDWYLNQLPAAENATVDLVAFDEAPTLVVTAAVLERSVGRVFLPGDFQFGDVTEFQDPYFFPGALKLGDVAGFLKIAKPQELVLWKDATLQERRDSIHKR